MDDILGEESDNDSEGKEKEERDEEDQESSRQTADYHQTLRTSVKDTSSSTSKEDSGHTGVIPRYCF